MYYTPRQNGIAKENASSLCYTETEPADSARELVYCFWELKTAAPLAKNFRYIVVPDACIDIVFDLRRGVVLIMTPHTSSEQIDLGVDFHYVGIRLHPGVYQGDLSQIIGGTLNVDTLGGERIAGIAHRLANMTFAEQQRELAVLVQKMASVGTLASNTLIAQLISHADTGNINDIARALGVSERQLRRNVRTATGFSPRELFKIINFQRSFTIDWTELYADQSHYIHSFRQITRQTPKQYERSYDVRNTQYSASTSR